MCKDQIKLRTLLFQPLAEKLLDRQNEKSTGGEKGECAIDRVRI